MNANQRMVCGPVFAWIFMNAIKKAVQQKANVLDLALVVCVSSFSSCLLFSFLSLYLSFFFVLQITCVEHNNFVWLIKIFPFFSTKTYTRGTHTYTVISTCDQEIKNNITYFISPNFPALMSTHMKSCKLKIKPISSDINQLRFDFVHFSIVNIWCLLYLQLFARKYEPFSINR